VEQRRRRSPIDEDADDEIAGSGIDVDVADRQRTYDWPVGNRVVEGVDRVELDVDRSERDRWRERNRLPRREWRWRRGGGRREVRQRFSQR